MSLGKTVCALTAIEALMYDSLEVRKTLVIAPLRVARSVWAEECRKWEHLNHLRVSKVLGSPEERRQALKRRADIYVINRENVCWLTKNFKWDFDLCVIDELSSFKSPSAWRFRSLRRVIGQCRRVIGLTGTPAPNGMMDLWAEIFLLDNGLRLGRTLTGYRANYFHPAWMSGFVVYKYAINAGCADVIKSKISDICISMNKRDYLDMPERVYQTVRVELPPAAMRLYREMERDCLITLGENVVTAMNAAAANTKLQQMAGGAVYAEDGSVKAIHDAKLEALAQLIEEANRQPVLVFVAYRHDRDRIRKYLGSAVHELNTEDDIAAWNAGKYPVAVAHPASIGHGLNLQQGGHIIIWYGLTWSLELYQQANDRLYRQGQTDTVSVYHLVAADTVDEACMAALASKDAGQNALMNYLKARREELKGEKTAC